MLSTISPRFQTPVLPPSTRPVYRRWTDRDSDSTVHAKIYPNGDILLVSYQDRRVRATRDEVRIYYSTISVTHDRLAQPACSKAEFADALDLATRKLAYLSRQT